MTMAFTTGAAPEDKLLELAKRNIRIKVLLTDPTSGEGLVRARNRIRHRYDRDTEERALGSLQEQIARLHDCKDYVEALKRNGCKGELEVFLSDLLPYAFVAHASRFAILGLFLATGSYGAGPMILVDAGANRHFWEALQGDWDARLTYTLEQMQSGPFVSEGAARGVISDAHFVSGIEADLPQETTDIWVAAPDLANVGDETSLFSELVRKTVRANSERGISYTYICPKGHAGRSRIRNLRECFEGTTGKLDLLQIPPQRFQEITLLQAHFIIFNPLRKNPEGYMQLPLAHAQKGWIRLSQKDTALILDKMKHLLAEFSREETGTKRPAL
jgi:hypothetical protein